MSSRLVWVGVLLSAFAVLLAPVCAQAELGHLKCAPTVKGGTLRMLVSHVGRQFKTPARSWFVLGDPGRTNPLRGTAREILHAISSELGLDASCAKIVVLDKTKLLERYRKGARGWSAGIEGLEGFQISGLTTDWTAFVHREPSGLVRPDVILHEVIHILSRGFSRTAKERHQQKLVEGLTQFFTQRVAMHRLEMTKSELLNAYPDEVVFVTRLAELVGVESLQQYFFSGDLRGLSQAVSRWCGRGAFGRAIRALDQRDLYAALAILE